MSGTTNKSESVDSPGITSGKQATLATLNDLLRNELAATHSYERALAEEEGPETRERFQKCERSHRDRAAWLRTQVLAHGGDPTETRRPWMVCDGAEAPRGLEDKMALMALAEGEENILRDYREALSRLDTSTRTAVSGEMILEQLRIYELIIQLKSAFEAPPIKWWRS